MHLSIFGLNLAASFSNVTLKMRSVMSMYKIHANFGKIGLKIMCIEVFRPKFCSFYFNVILKVKVRSPIFTLACSHVHILNSFKFG